MSPDGRGRTLLAWRGLVVMSRFMAVALCPYMQPPGRGTGFRVIWGFMTSEERREARYQKRRARRLAKKRERLRELNDYEKVFSYRNLYDAYRKSRRGVAWKASVQRYIIDAPCKVWQTYDLMRGQAFEPKGFYEFDLIERGKKRHIRSVGIGERVVQRCLCDHCLVPALSRTFVYDNAASLEGKGYAFSMERMKHHLQWHYRRHGTEGYILLFDLKGFFDSIPHDKAMECIVKEITDPSLLCLCKKLIDIYPGDHGLGLGSQISQIVSLVVLSPLDHFLKDHLGIKCYGRYMDDGYVIHADKNYLRQVMAGIGRVCKSIGVSINEGKTQIVKLSRGFTWLKVRHWLLSSGRVLRKPGKKSATKARARLRSLYAKVEAGQLTANDVWLSFESWRSYVSRLDAHRTVMETTKMLEAMMSPS